MSEALFVGFFGVLVGAILQFLLVRRASQEVRYLELKSNAYADSMNGIVSGSLASDLEKPKAQEMVTAAKMRICVLGDSDVVESIVKFENIRLAGSNEESLDALKSLIGVMRTRGVASGKVDDSAFDLLLFGKQIVEGGIYSIDVGDGTFGVAKILKLEPPVVHVRLYKNKLHVRPASVKLEELSLGTSKDTDRIGIGHIPSSEKTFAGWKPVLLVKSQVTESELEGYKRWKEAGGGVFEK
jgi:hypothetical protein